MIFYIKKVIYIAFVMVCMLMAVFAIYFVYNCVVDFDFRRIYLFGRWI